MRIIFEEENVTVHGKAVPETGRISIVEHVNTNSREFVWEPIAAGDWTFLGGSAFDSGFRQELSEISEIRKPSQDGSGLRYIVIKLKDGAILPSLHFSPGGVERVENALQSFFVIKDVGAGVCKLEAVKQPKAKLSLWEDVDDKNKPISGKDIINQTFGLFSKITKVIQENLAEERPLGNNYLETDGHGDRGHSQPELSRERPVIIRSEPVSVAELEAHIRAKQYKLLRNNIFKGGLTPEARPEAWKQILGIDKLDRMGEKYQNLRTQWENQMPEQLEYNSLLKERRALIGKDVIRTEPTRLEDADVNRLSDLLTTYCVFDQDLGYVQGMSDIAVVILDIYPDDCEAFWVFTRFMQRIRGNFEKSQKAIKQQFEALRRILAFTDGEMIRFLDRRDSGHMYFTFPWFLIIFRRLASWETLPLIWDVWLTSPCSNFHLLIAAAILDIYREEIMQEEFGYCEILQFVNRLNGCINTDDVLARAQSLLIQIENCISTPPVVKQLLTIK